MSPQEKDRIRNFLLRRIDYPTLESIIDQNYRYAKNEFEPDYTFHNFNYGIATLIVEDLQIMNYIDLNIDTNNSGLYDDLIDYFYDTLKNSTRKLYDKLTNNTNLQEQIRSVLKEIEEDRIQIRLGRSAERHFGKVQNIIIMVDDQDITSEDDVPGLGKMNIVIKDNEIVVGDIFIPEKYRKQGIATIVYQKISDYFNLPIVNSKTKGFNQTIEGGYIWKKRERFEPKNLQEHIRKVLKEETSIQKKLMGLFKNQGIKAATTAVGGFDNFSKILNLDLDDMKTQEMLVKNFIYHSKLEGVDILHLEIGRNRPDKVRIKIHFDTNVYNSNVESWVTRTMSDEINKFFPFKSTPYWEPVFASRGVTVVLDSEQITNEDDEDEMNLQETELTERCWKGYTQKGMKTMFGKRYPNCVKKKK